MEMTRIGMLTHTDTKILRLDDRFDFVEDGEEEWRKEDLEAFSRGS